MLIYESNCNIDFLKQDFTEYQFKLFKSKSLNYINCFVCYIEDENRLIKDWKNIVGLISGNFQCELESELEIWNIYLIFCTKYKIDDHLRYEIENNRFAMRKLITNNQSWEGSYSIEEYIKEEIFCADLELANKISHSDASDNSVISSLHEKIISICDLENLDKENFEICKNQINELIELVAKNEI